MPSQDQTVNASKQPGRPRRLRSKRPERRLGERDRRLLDATMKYRGEFVKVELYDLSETGAYVVAPDMPMLCDSVTFTIDRPQQACAIMITGRVRRVGLSCRALAKRGGFGVEFTRFYSKVGRMSLEQHLAA